MNRGLLLFGLCLIGIPAYGQLEINLGIEPQTPETPEVEATHQQVATIKLQDDDANMNINAFCLDKQGHLVAACGMGPGKIQIADDTGRILKSWKVEVKPEAVNVAPDGTILVGGEGKLFRFDSEGSLLKQADSPHAIALRSDKEKLRSEAVAFLNRSRNSLQMRIESYQMVIAQLEEKATKGDLNDQEQKMLELLPKTLKTFQDQAEKEALARKERGETEPKISEQAIQNYIENQIRSKMKVSSISADDKHVFVATRDLAGYGYAIWKMDSQFAGGESIVSGLRGCCGQMDVQCCTNGLFVAENSRHRVVRFDFAGDETTTWGKQDRTGADGFSSCCNPMNVCFNGANEVYTAESGTGRIKRFDANGKLLSYVGDVELVPGCKNVSIAASPTGDKVYMLDLTRNHIILMQNKDSVAETDLAVSGE